MADPLDLARELERQALSSPGETGEPLRRAVVARAANLSGERGTGDPAAGAIPPALAAALDPYIEKVVRHAYRVTPEDLAALAAAGLSEDGIFEITVAAATAAGLARLRRGLAALAGGKV
jgi:alkylhydroperoxidase family enzyme